MENEEVGRGQNSMSFKEKDLFNKRQREQWALSKYYRNKRRRELRLKKSDNQHTDNYTRYRQQLNSGRSEGIICNHSEVGNLLDTDTSDVLDNMKTNIIGTVLENKKNRAQVSCREYYCYKLQIQPLWRYYFQNTQDLIFVVARDELDRMLNEMLFEPYKGIDDCFKRTIKEEGFSVVRYIWP